MSLINEVLNDLEKRGVAREATGDGTVRVVSLQSEMKFWPYFFAGFLFCVVATSIWLYARKPVVHQLPIVQQQPATQLAAVSSPVPIAGVLSISQVAIASQPQVISSEEQPPKPNLVYLQGKPQVNMTKPVSEVHASPVMASQSIDNERLSMEATKHLLLQLKLEKSIDKEQLSMDATASKPIKKVSPQQQAENEFRRAYILAQQGKMDDAVIGYKLALSLDPSHEMAREALVSVLQESKRYTEAEKVLQDALGMDDKQTHFAMLLARLQVERSDVPMAIQTLEKSLPYATRLADYQAFIAALLQRQGRNKEAITFYQNALQLSPASGLWLMGLGISLQAESHKEEAMDAYNRALATHNMSPELEAFVKQKIKEIKPKE